MFETITVDCKRYMVELARDSSRLLCGQEKKNKKTRISRSSATETTYVIECVDRCAWLDSSGPRMGHMFDRLRHTRTHTRDDYILLAADKQNEVARFETRDSYRERRKQLPSDSNQTSCPSDDNSPVLNRSFVFKNEAVWMSATSNAVSNNASEIYTQERRATPTRARTNIDCKC